MTRDHVQSQIERIKLHINDSEMQHSIKERLYLDALQEIANNDDVDGSEFSNSQLAAAVLEAETIPIKWGGCA